VYELSIRTRFSAAHHLAGYPGACASWHGHNWDVEVFVRGTGLNDLGMLVDFRELKTVVSEAVQDLDHRNLNELGPFRDQNPTSENIARWLFDRLTGSLRSPAFAVSRVRVHETPDAAASYEADPATA
jgi:6-pyruvoyltetrahydropterin/6-carboxytetrahydropterin synthase